jgi:DNA-binding transcriptional ArsR family regulator
MAALPTPAAQALLGALADHPGATASQLAEAAGIGRSTAGKLLVTLAAGGQVLRQPGGLKGGRRAADAGPSPPRHQPGMRGRRRLPRRRLPPSSP